MIKRIQRPTFAVCVDNTGYRASLEAGKLYEVVSDRAAKKHGLIRVIDESGEDYGYSVKRLFILPVPSALEKMLKSGETASQTYSRSKPARRIATKTEIKKKVRSSQ